MTEDEHTISGGVLVGGAYNPYVRKNGKAITRHCVKRGVSNRTQALRCEKFMDGEYPQGTYMKPGADEDYPEYTPKFKPKKKNAGLSLGHGAYSGGCENCGHPIGGILIGGKAHKHGSKAQKAAARDNPWLKYLKVARKEAAAQDIEFHMADWKGGYPAWKRANGY